MSESTEMDFENCYNHLKFPNKLWRIVNENTTGAIQWGNYGKSIAINNVLFQAEYLDCPNPMFKTKNMSSFVRQLNMYGFRKHQSHVRNPTNNIHCFINGNFQRDRPDLLSNVKRRVAQLKKIDYFSPPVLEDSNSLIQSKRKTFEDILLSTPDLVEFWEVLNNIRSPDSITIKPRYQLNIVPIRNFQLFDNQTAVAEMPADFQHLVTYEMPAEPDESDDDEETDEACDLELVELSTLTDSGRDEIMPNVAKNTFEPILNENVFLKEESGDSYYDRFINIFTGM